MRGSVETVAAEAEPATDEKPTGEYSTIGEKPVGENSPSALLAKIQKPLKSASKHFSPMEFSPMPEKHFSPMKKREFSPMTKPAKKPRLSLVKPAKNGQRGRPRNPDLPPAPGKYYYWTKAGNGLKLERRKPDYEYVGFIQPSEWQHLRGNFDEEYILRAIIAAIRVKRARAAQGRRPGALTA